MLNGAHFWHMQMRPGEDNPKVEDTIKILKNGFIWFRRLGAWQ
ncbi:hypothetical protein [Helicobacter cetorum]|nr:hypothetical protein [Helicobacter cetorum]